MSKRKKKEGPSKLETTVKRIGPEGTTKDTGVPEYKKPWHEFHKTVQEGDFVRIHRRHLDQKIIKFSLVIIEGILEEKSTNTCYIRTEETVLGVPWYAIHDWEINPEE